MERTDDRASPSDFPWLVIGTDSFLSGWGKAEGGASYAAWACTRADLDQVEKWVRDRSDMLRVRVVYDPDGKYRPNARLCAHFHVYDVGVDHPARGYSRGRCGRHACHVPASRLVPGEAWTCGNHDEDRAAA